MTSHLERRLARLEAAHAAATAPARWICRVTSCPQAGRDNPAPSRAEALRAADAHYESAHPTPPPPADLEEQRAAWNAAGRPPLGRVLG